MFQKSILIANWKMNGNASMLASYLQRLKALTLSKNSKVELVICPPSLYISSAVSFLRNAGPSLKRDQSGTEENGTTAVYIGGQAFSHMNCNGSYTGFINASMLKDVGCTHGIVAHSESRAALKYTNNQISGMITAALSNGIVPIVCFGEKEKTKFAAKQVIKEASEVIRASWEHWQQLQNNGVNGATTEKPSPYIGRKNSIATAGAKEEIVIAYEPIWSIGSGELPSTSYIQEITDGLQQEMKEIQGFNCRIAYGGSVSTSNINDVMSIPSVSGAVVGGASLDANNIIEMVDIMGRHSKQ